MVIPTKILKSSVLNYSCVALCYLKTPGARDEAKERLVAFDFFLHFSFTETLIKCSR